jgi:hypothetical protein
VLAFKRSLSAGILDGGQSEISLGGSRLSRFMKDVENVTGRMGEGEAMVPAEEAASVASASVESPVEGAAADESAIAGDIASAADASTAIVAASALREAGVDPWAVLLQAGAQLVSALSAAGVAGAASHPWLERDPTTGACSLRLPLPPPQTAQRLADALSGIADSLRETRAGE